MFFFINTAQAQAIIGIPSTTPLKQETQSSDEADFIIDQGEYTIESVSSLCELALRNGNEKIRMKWIQKKKRRNSFLD